MNLAVGAFQFFLAGECGERKGKCQKSESVCRPCGEFVRETLERVCSTGLPRSGTQPLTVPDSSAVGPVA